MNDTLEFPPIEAPAATLAPASIKSAVLAQFADAERTVRSLADKYSRVAYDCTTPKGMADAKAARMDLRENGRYAVQRAESRVKTEVNDLKRVMADEVERIVGIVRPVEDAIDQQIKAEEARKEAERQERERLAAEAARIEAERRQRMEDGISTLAAYVAKAKGATAEKMAAGIAFVEKIVIDPAYWQEYTERAATTLADTLQTLREMHAAQIKAEADAAELEALRREKAERDARERAAREAEAAAQAEFERLERQAEDSRRRQVMIEAAAMPPLTEARVGDIMRTLAADSEMTAAWPLPKADPAPAPVEAPVADPEPQDILINLGEFARRLEFPVSAAMLAGFGIQPTTTHKAAKLYPPSAWPRLCDALVTHITTKRGAY